MPTALRPASNYAVCALGTAAGQGSSRHIRECHASGCAFLLDDLSRHTLMNAADAAMAKFIGEGKGQAMASKASGMQMKRGGWVSGEKAGRGFFMGTDC